MTKKKKETAKQKPTKASPSKFKGFFTKVFTPVIKFFKEKETKSSLRLAFTTTLVVAILILITMMNVAFQNGSVDSLSDDLYSAAIRTISILAGSLVLFNLVIVLLYKKFSTIAMRLSYATLLPFIFYLINYTMQEYGAYNSRMYIAIPLGLGGLIAALGYTYALQGILEGEEAPKDKVKKKKQKTKTKKGKKK